MVSRKVALGALGIIAAVMASLVAITLVNQSATASPSSSRAAEAVRYVPENLFGVAFVNGKAGWVSGYYGTILQTSDGGDAWVRRPLPQNDLIRRIKFIDDHRGWLVTHRGRILYTSDGGSNWVVQHEIPGVYLRDIFMVDSTFGWAVGHDQTILFTSNGGRKWDIQSIAHETQDLPRLNGVAAYDSQNAVVVGEFGFIARTQDGGQTWSLVRSPLSVAFTAVAVAGDHAVAVGLDGAAVFIPKVGEPSVMSAGSGSHLFDIALDGSGSGFAVGAGSAFKVSGAVMAPVKIDLKQGADLVWLGGVGLLPGNGAVAVGSHGLMLRYQARTNTFEPLSDWTK